jgi:hypothetical protein
MSNTIEDDYWHPAFVGAVEIEFRAWKDDLEYLPEHILNKRPIKIDLLIIKRDKNLFLDNQIGNIFRTYNIMEYKSPSDGITNDDYYKTVAYAYLYKSHAENVDAVPGDELTVTMMREAYPRELFRTIEKYGGTVERKYPGVYYISGIFNTPSQFVVIQELDKNLHPALRLLSKKVEPTDVERFLLMALEFTDQGDRNNADAVLQPSVSANRAVYEDVRRKDPTMCEALRELMNDDIEKEIKERNREAVDASAIAMIKAVMENFGVDAAKAMNALRVPQADQLRYAAML